MLERVLYRQLRRAACRMDGEIVRLGLSQRKEAARYKPFLPPALPSDFDPSCQTLAATLRATYDYTQASDEPGNLDSAFAALRRCHHKPSCGRSDECLAGAVSGCRPLPIRASHPNRSKSGSISARSFVIRSTASAAYVTLRALSPASLLISPFSATRMVACTCMLVCVACMPVVRFTMHDILMRALPRARVCSAAHAGE